MIETHDRQLKMKEDTVFNRTYQKWFAKLRASKFSLNYSSRFGKIYSHQVTTLFENNQRKDRNFLKFLLDC